MSKYVKKQALGCKFTLVVIILSIISAVLYSLNLGSGYYNDAGSLVMPLTITAIVLSGISLLIGQFSHKNVFFEKVTDILRMAVPVLLVSALIIFLSFRVYSFAIIFGSALEANNAVAQAAAMQAIIGLIVYAVTAITATFATFFDITKLVKSK